MGRSSSSQCFELLVKNALEVPKTAKTTAAVSCLPDLDSEPLLLRISHALLTEHTEIELELG